MTTTANTKIEIAASLAGKYLTFVLERESYGIPVLNVREIIKLVSITAVPKMPAHIKGVVNLRGKIIPVVDLRSKFGLETTDATECTCIVVVQGICASKETMVVGVVVDAVEEVCNITAADLEDTPDFGTSIDTSFIVAMAKIKGGVTTLLSIERVLGGTCLPSFTQS